MAGQPVGDTGEQEVRAQCWGTGLVLGRAEQFRAFMNFGLGATLVELERYGEIRVLLLRAGADGKPLLEDLSASLAVAAGREPWGRLKGLSLEFGEFARGGRIGFSRAGGDSPGRGERERASRAGAVDIAQHIAQASQRHAPAGAGEQR